MLPTRDQEFVISKYNPNKKGYIIVGQTGSGKSMVGLECFKKYLKTNACKKLVIITPAKKRDTNEWILETERCGISTPLEVNSWNNIQKYVDIKDAFVIFDEAKMTGYKSWGKAFVKIANRCNFLVLSATPATEYIQLLPFLKVFGMYKTLSAFETNHVIFKPFVQYKKIQRYINTKLIDDFLSPYVLYIDYVQKVHIVDNIVHVDGKVLTKYSDYGKTASEYNLQIRKEIFSDPSRLDALVNIIKHHHKVIVFYTNKFELELICGRITPDGIWNGDRHDSIPNKDKWVYVVQICASEGWNCIECDTLVFFGYPYGYKYWTQARGRINRRNTTKKVLYYYVLTANTPYEKKLSKRIKDGMSFNGI